MADLNFNANDVDPSSGVGPIPAGRYELQAIEADVKPANSGRGEVLSLTYEVIGGEYNGRKIWERMNIAHESPVAQKIGQEQLSALCHATGELQISDTEQLLWKPFQADLKTETYPKSDGSTGERNAVKKYIFDVDGAPPAAKPAPTAQKRTAQQAHRQPAARQASAGNGGGRNVPWNRGNQQQTADFDDDIPF